MTLSVMQYTRARPTIRVRLGRHVGFVVSAQTGPVVDRRSGVLMAATLHTPTAKDRQSVTRGKEAIPILKPYLLLLVLLLYGKNFNIVVIMQIA